MSERVRVRAVFGELRGLAAALEDLQHRELREVRVYSPVGLPELERVLPRPASPVRFLVLAASLTGAFLGFLMAVGSAWTYGLIVGAKHPPALTPYFIPGFEFNILLGGVTAFFMMLWLARVSPYRVDPDYDPRFNEDKFGLVVSCPPEQVGAVVAMLREAGAEEADERRRSGN
jgi:hypothetical protein